MERRTLLAYTSSREDRENITRVLARESLLIIAPEGRGHIIEDIRAHDPDIVLLEVSEATAEQEVRSIARRGRAGRPAVVALSRHHEHEALLRLLSCGADDVLRFPVEDVELTLRIEATFMRIEARERVIEDRNYYSDAVKQEEYLASMALDRSIDLQKAYAKLMAINERLRDQNARLKQAARIDMLSGLMNRLSLYDFIDTEVERAIRNELALCGIMVDVDRFKQINDNYGHSCGDEVIRYLGKFLRRRLRRYDAAGRYGGEEFFVVLPDTHLSQAQQFAARFRQNLESTSIDCNGTTLSVTASLGIAEYRRGESRDAWISRADRAMYAAKQRGRNRVEIELDREAYIASNILEDPI
jgi:diguanylate cyclase (GGDEF)-like protein